MTYDLRNEESAKKALSECLAGIAKVAAAGRLSPEHIRWRTNTYTILEEIFGQDSAFFLGFAGLSFSFRGNFMASAYDFEGEVAVRQQESFLRDLGIARGLIESGIDQINRKGIDNVYEGKNTSRESSDIVKIVSLIENKLRKAIRAPPKRESEVLDALETLFIGGGLDGEFTREKEHIVYSSKTYIPDFTFKRLSTVVEGKLCDSPKRMKEIISEINDDIVAYGTKYPNRIFAVYDIGIISDQDAFKTSIETHDHVIVRVVKH